VSRSWLYVIRTDGQIDEEFLCCALPEQERTRVLRYRNRQDRLNSLAALLAAKVMLAPYCWPLPPMQQTVFGRPYVESPGWRGDFNLAHSGGMAVCALLPAGRVGVDMEKIGQVQDETASYCLAEAEWRHWNAQPDSRSRQELFHRYWTLKEAYIKLQGTGMGLIAPDSLQFELHDDASATLLTPARLAFHSCRIDERYSLSVCVTGSLPKQPHVILSMEELIAEYLDLYPIRRK
jgi:phosphopantetheinyl transferase